MIMETSFCAIQSVQLRSSIHVLSYSEDMRPLEKVGLFSHHVHQKAQLRWQIGSLEMETIN